MRGLASGPRSRLDVFKVDLTGRLGADIREQASSLGTSVNAQLQKDVHSDDDGSTRKNITMYKSMNFSSVTAHIQSELYNAARLAFCTCSSRKCFETYSQAQ